MNKTSSTVNRNGDPIVIKKELKQENLDTIITPQIAASLTNTQPACLICNRPLSNPESIDKGIGPYCEKIISKVLTHLNSGNDLETTITQFSLSDETIENIVFYLWKSRFSEVLSKISIPRKYLGRLINELFIAGWSIDLISSELRVSKSFVFSKISFEAKKIRLLYLYEEQKLSYPEMSRILGIQTSTLKNWLRQVKPKRRRDNRKRLTQYAENYEKIIAHYFNLTGIRPIVDQYDLISTQGVRKILENAGITILQNAEFYSLKRHASGFFYRPINEHLEEVIIGQLLGDATLMAVGKKSSDGLPDPSSDEYLKAMKMIQHVQSNYPVKMRLDEAVSKFNESIEIFRRSQVAFFRLAGAVGVTPWIQYIGHLFEKSGYEVKPYIYEHLTESMYEIRVSSSVQLYSVYRHWYPNGEKKLPRNLKLTPDILLHWFVGDGSNVDGYITIATQCFSARENEFLANLIEHHVGVDCNVYSYTQKGRKYNKLKINKSDAPKFYEYIVMAQPETVAIAKDVFPWKFNAKLRKKDHIKLLQFTGEARQRID